jgi:cysteine desulfurase
MQRTRDRLEGGLRERVLRVRVNGHPDHRLPNTLSVSVHGIDANVLLGAIEEKIAASAGAPAIRAGSTSLTCSRPCRHRRSGRGERSGSRRDE